MLESLVPEPRIRAANSRSVRERSDYVLYWMTAARRTHDKYAVDGRDPNSYSGIFWCLGRFDRPWAPKRPIFGSIRYMSSASAAKKLDLEQYLSRFGV